MNRRIFIKRMNRTLAGMIGILGFAACEKESGVNFTVIGSVVNKENGKPVAGVHVGYVGSGYYCKCCPRPMYGTTPTPYKPKANVMTNKIGEFKLSDRFLDEELQIVNNNLTLQVYVHDAANGLFQPEIVLVDFSRGKHTANVKVELTKQNIGD